MVGVEVVQCDEGRYLFNAGKMAKIVSLACYQDGRGIKDATSSTQNTRACVIGRRLLALD